MGSSSAASARRKPLDLTGIDWVIVGGESGGKQARPMHPDWAREIRDACIEIQDARRAVDAPEEPAFFFKQWGSWVPYENDPQPPFLNGQDGQTIDGHAFPPGLSENDPVDGWWWPYPDDEVIYRYAGASPKSGGRLLDGRTWNEFPVRAAVEATA